MDFVIAYALIGYFESLYDLNRSIITLCGLDVEDNFGQYEKLLNSVIITIPQLVPYKRDRANDKYIIISKDGLLEFSDEIPYLQEDYENLLQKHYDFLASVKRIRNKFEHKMHGAQLIGRRNTCGQVSFSMTYSVEGQEIELNSSNIISFISDLNTLFAKLQESVAQFAKEKVNQYYSFYHRLLHFDFADFNKIYESNILHIIGKSLFPF